MIPKVSAMDSIRQKIIAVLNDNPLYSAKKVCEVLQLDYKKYKQQIWNAKTYYKNRQGLKGSISFHAVRYFSYALKSMDRGSAIGNNWIQSKGKNRVLIFKNELGRIEWFETGLIVAWVKRANQGRLFQLLSGGFSYNADWLSYYESWLNSFRLKGSHLVQDIGQPLPYAKNTLFKDSLGITVKMGDRSHRRGLELEFCLPNFVEDFRLMHVESIKTFKAFNDLMNDMLAPKSVKDMPKEMIS